MARKHKDRNRTWLFGLVVLLGLALGHGGDLEIREARVIHTPEGNFLELALAYPRTDTPLTLTIVVTPMGDGVLEVKTAGGYLQTAKMPIPYGVSLISDRTRYRIRLPQDAHKASGPLPVTLFSLAGAWSPSRPPSINPGALGLWRSASEPCWLARRSSVSESG